MAKEPVEPPEHDAWFRAEVQRALDDPRPGIPHDAVMDQIHAIIDRITIK
jgi:DNA-damage-inducible protein J